MERNGRKPFRPVSWLRAPSRLDPHDQWPVSPGGIATGKSTFVVAVCRRTARDRSFRLRSGGPRDHGRACSGRAVWRRNSDPDILDARGPKCRVRVCGTSVFDDCRSASGARSAPPPGGPPPLHSGRPRPGGRNGPGSSWPRCLFFTNHRFDLPRNYEIMVAVSPATQRARLRAIPGSRGRDGRAHPRRAMARHGKGAAGAHRRLERRKHPMPEETSTIPEEAPRSAELKRILEPSGPTSLSVETVEPPDRRTTGPSASICMRSKSTSWPSCMNWGLARVAGWRQPLEAPTGFRNLFALGTTRARSSTAAACSK